MSTVNEQALLSPLALGDMVLVWSPSQGDTRRTSFTAVLALMQANLVFPVTPVAPGSVIFMPFVGGTDNLIVSPAVGVVLPANPTFGQTIEFIAVGNNTGPMTVIVGAQPVQQIRYNGVALAGGEVKSGGSVVAIYDGVRYQLVSVAATAASTPPKTTVPRLLENIGLSVVANTPVNGVTITLTGADGAALAAGNIGGLSFRDPTLTVGGSTKAQVVAPVSTVISAGSTGGTVGNQASRLWVAAMLVGAAVELAWFNSLSGVNILPIDEGGTLTTTAEGGVGGADSAQTWYSTTARANVPFVIVACFESTQVVAGNWASVITRTVVNPQFRPLDLVNLVRTDTGTTATGTTSLPIDNTIPQNTEGDQYMTQAITPKSAANILRVTSVVCFSVDAAVDKLGAAIFQDATANAIVAANAYQNGGAVQPSPIVLQLAKVAGTTVSTTFKTRAGPHTGGNTGRLNGINGGQVFGGICNSFMQAEEISV